MKTLAHMEIATFDFSAGSSRKHFEKEVNYLLIKGEVDGDEVELYSEVLFEDHPDWERFETECKQNDGFHDNAGKDITDFCNQKFDAWSYELLKADIIRQAVEQGIDPDEIDFSY